MGCTAALPVLILALVLTAGGFALLAFGLSRELAVGLFALSLACALVGFALNRLERRIACLEHQP